MDPEKGTVTFSYAPNPFSTMLCIHCVQKFLNLSDRGMEDLLYEVSSARQ